MKSVLKVYIFCFLYFTFLIWTSTYMSKDLSHIGVINIVEVTSAWPYYLGKNIYEIYF